MLHSLPRQTSAKKIKTVEAVAEDPVQEDAVMAEGGGQSRRMHDDATKERNDRIDRESRMLYSLGQTDPVLVKRPRSTSSDDDNDNNEKPEGGVRAKRRMRGGSKEALAARAKAKAGAIDLCDTSDGEDSDVDAGGVADDASDEEGGIVSLPPAPSSAAPVADMDDVVVQIVAMPTNEVSLLLVLISV